MYVIPGVWNVPGLFDSRFSPPFLQLASSKSAYINIYLSYYVGRVVNVTDHHNEYLPFKLRWWLRKWFRSVISDEPTLANVWQFSHIYSALSPSTQKKKDTRYIDSYISVLSIKSLQKDTSNQWILLEKCNVPYNVNCHIFFIRIRIWPHQF